MDAEVIEVRIYHFVCFYLWLPFAVGKMSRRPTQTTDSLKVNNRQQHKLYFKTMDSEFGCIAMFLIKIILTLSRGLKFQYVI